MLLVLLVQVPSSLWNAMVAPLRVIRVAAFLWWVSLPCRHTLPWRPLPSRTTSRALLENQSHSDTRYQGETNADKPVLYRRCFPAMIEQWRKAFPPRTTAITTDDTTPVQTSTVPFVFVQLAPWPEQNSGLLPAMRYAQQEGARTQANVGMVVAADLGDPGGVFHPIHTPFKQEVGRRAALAIERLVYGNKSVPLHGMCAL